MTDDSPAVIPFNSDGYELPVLDGQSATNVPAILSGGVDGYGDAHPIAVDTSGHQLVGEQHKLVPAVFDAIEFSYVPPKNTLIDTITYKSNGITVATVTFAYDAKDNVISMTRT